ncbi:MAG: aminopeptidase P N-terminal domain-containing protein [Acidobacteriota bacterium]
MFESRRKKLMDTLYNLAEGRPFLSVLFSGNSPNLDRFVVDSNFFYYTGIEIQNSAYVILFDGKNFSEVLFLPPPNPLKARWELMELSSGHLDKLGNADAARKKAIKETGFGAVLSNYELFDFLAKPLNIVKEIYLDLSIPLTIGSESAVRFFDDVRRQMPSVVAKNLRSVALKQRNVKEASEIEKIKKSVNVAIEAQNAIMDILQPGMYEYEVEAVVKYVFTKNGAQGESFATIIGSGKNSTILHYNQNRKMIGKNETVVCDLGAKKENYCSDLTRTYPSSSKFTKEQKRYYEVVLQAQEIAISTIKAGVSIGDVNKAVADFFISKGFGKFNFHGVSHHIGIDVHDGGSVDEPLSENCVITVEPGLYNQREKIGVRIEDNVVVKKNGVEIISKDLIKDISDIEKRMSKPRKKILV